MGALAALDRSAAPFSKGEDMEDTIKAAVAAGAGAEVVRELIAADERRQAMEARRAFDAAIRAVRKQLRPIIKSHAVAAGNKSYKHEDLLDISEHVDPLLDDHGLHYRYGTEPAPAGHVSVALILTHEGGHSEVVPLTAPADASGGKSAAQAVGSTVTYLQRYALRLALGIRVVRDDDGRASSGAITITDRQREEIERGIEETASNLEAFLRHFGVDDIAQMPAGRFAEARGLLDRKRARHANS